MHSFRELGINCIGTCRSKSHHIVPNLIAYDIAKDPPSVLEGIPLSRRRTAVICAAVSSIDRCRRDFEYAYRVNVLAAKDLVTFLSRSGYHVVYLSTDNVFDGEKGNYTEDDEARPINAYGQMKHELEEFLLGNIPKSTILRLSKVTGKPNDKRDMLTEWRDYARENKLIRCIEGNRFSPVCIDDAVSAVRLVSEEELYGLYHIAGDRAYFRSELCREFLEYVGLKAEIRELPESDFGFLERRPIDTSLSVRKYQNAGGRVSSIKSIFYRYKEQS